MSGPIVINAPCTFIRIEIRRATDGHDEIQSAEVIRTEALEEFFGQKGLADWIRRINEAPFDRRRF